MAVLLEPRYCECGRKGISRQPKRGSATLRRWSTSEIRAENEPHGQVMTFKIR